MRLDKVPSAADGISDFRVRSLRIVDLLWKNRLVMVGHIVVNLKLRKLAPFRSHTSVSLRRFALSII